MTSDTTSALRRVFDEVLDACDPASLLAEHIHLDDEHLEIGDTSYDLATFERIFVVGAGKAGAPMAAALETILGERIDRGLVVVREGYGGPTERIDIVEAAHPTPDGRSVDAGARIREICEAAESGDLVLVLLSGGGSALLVEPAAGLSLRDMQTTVDELVSSGADIHQINTVRKHLSTLKGGQLAAAIAPATSATIILSDVVGNDLSTIASGPTVPDPTTFEDALSVIVRYNLLESLPASVIEHLQEGARGQFPEPPKPGAPVFADTNQVIIGDGRTVARAAAQACEGRGWSAHILATQLTGEAREVARVVAAIGEEAVHDADGTPGAFIMTGETTVTVRGEGVGGRNQELALAAALRIDGTDRLQIASLATDGTDGPTDAAGAVVDGETADALRRAGLDPHAMLADNDAYRALDAVGTLVRTGPTRTNLNDLIIIRFR